MSQQTLCECRDLKKSYSNNRVLTGCNFTLQKGELVGLVGENGSGKSTLVRCLLGYTTPDSGDIEMHVRPGYCPQNEIMNSVYTLDEHLLLMQDIYKQRFDLDSAYIQHLIRTFNLEEYLNQQIGNLSGGTRRKVQFITSILHQPSLLLLDEPYGGFDWEMYLVFWDVLDELCKAGTGVLLITHFVYDNDRFNRIYHLKNGQLSEHS